MYTPKRVCGLLIIQLDMLELAAPDPCCRVQILLLQMVSLQGATSHIWVSAAVRTRKPILRQDIVLAPVRWSYRVIVYDANKKTAQPTQTSPNTPPDISRCRRQKRLTCMKGEWRHSYYYSYFTEQSPENLYISPLCLIFVFWNPNRIQIA